MITDVSFLRSVFAPRKKRTVNLNFVYRAVANSLGIIFLFLISCSTDSNKDERVTFRVVYNPYGEIDFSSASRVKAISHEHIYTEKQLKIAYDRGIRYFACVTYFPACPSYPLSGWSFDYEDYVSPTNLTLATFNYSGSIKSFIDKDGNIIETDSLVQLPNAEHAFYAETGSHHFNVLGSLFGECTNGTRTGGEWSEAALGIKKANWYAEHPKWSINDINNQYLDKSKQLFPGKVFGTINHTDNEKYTKKLLDTCPDVFKAIEIVNQAISMERDIRCRALWDKLLTEGRRVWGTAVVDWQKDSGLGACNVLLINDYEEQSLLKKAEMGLDAYLSGSFIPAGLANNDVINLSCDQESIHIQVTGTPTEIVAVTNLDKYSFPGVDRVDFKVKKGMSYVRFDIWYYDDEGNLKDFLFTNPIFIECQ